MKIVYAIVYVPVLMILAIAMLGTTNVSFAAGLTATPNPFSFSNSIIDVGQISIANTVISGGTGPYSGSYSFTSSNSAGNNVVDTIAVGTALVGVAFNPSGTIAYVTNYGNSKVSVIDTATNTIVNTITVGSLGSDPYGVAFNPSGTLAYVTNYGSGTVNSIDTATNTIVNTITVGTNPEGVAFNPSGTLAYVTNYGSGTVNVIDTATNTIVNTITVGTNPEGVAFNPSGTLAYVTNYGSGTVNVIDTATNTIVNTITVGTNPEGVAFNPSGTLAYVTNYGSGTVNVIDPSETSMQNLPSINALTLNIDAVSSDIVALIFNGVESQFSTDSSTIYGAWTFYGYAQDSTTGLAGITGLTGTNTITSSNTLTINPAPTATSFTPSNTVVNPGQYVTYNVIINGGTLPITANVVLVSNSIPIQINGANAISGTTYNTIVLGVGSVEPNAITFNSLELNTASTSGGNVIFAVKAVDGASTPLSFNSISNTVIINAVVTQQSSGGNGPAEYTFTLSDNINSSLASTKPVYTLYTSNGNTTYYQNQLPLILSSRTPYINVSWACNVSINTTAYTYQNDVYGLGFGIPCGKHYNAYAHNIESIYSISSPAKINTTTTSTTTIIPITTIFPVNRSIIVRSTLSSSLPISINFTDMNVIVELTTTSLMPVQVSTYLINETSFLLPSPANYTLISALNVSVSTTANVSVKVTAPYSCGVNSSLIKPFELVHGTWYAIMPFSINATSCVVSFAVSKDTVVGLFQKVVPVTTTRNTTVNTTTTIASAVAKPQPQSNYTVPVVLIVIVVIVVIMVYFYRMRGRRRR